MSLLFVWVTEMVRASIIWVSSASVACESADPDRPVAMCDSCLVNQMEQDCGC